jgi:hypothetical protein
MPRLASLPVRQAYSPIRIESSAGADRAAPAAMEIRIRDRRSIKWMAERKGTGPTGDNRIALLID